MTLEAVGTLLHVGREYLLDTGRVKFWKPTEGWGVITPDDGSEEVFIHRRDIGFKDKKGKKNLQQGQKLKYDTVRTANGLMAINVRNG